MATERQIQAGEVVAIGHVLRDVGLKTCVIFAPAVCGESTVVDERAVEDASAVKKERAEVVERAMVKERAVKQERTARLKRARGASAP